MVLYFNVMYTARSVVMEVEAVVVEAHPIIYYDILCAGRRWQWRTRKPRNRILIYDAALC